VVVVDRFVVDAAREASDEGIGRIAAERDLGGVVFRSPGIAIDGFADEQRHRDTTAVGTIAKLSIRRFRESEVRRHQARHGDMTISRYRLPVNGILRADARA